MALLRLALALPAVATASMYDVVVAAAAPPSECPLGCAPWADVAAAHNTAAQGAVDALWASPAAQAAAGASCAMPAIFGGQPEAATAYVVSHSGVNASFDFSYGAQCYCAGTPAAPTSAWGYCLDQPAGTPQQVNVVFGADQHELVVQFVTVGAASAGAPVVELCDGGGACVNATGTTEAAPEPQAPDRVLAYHVVVLPALSRGGNYTYRVRSGAPGGTWSRSFALRPRPEAAAPTVLGVVGDLGVYPFNCFSNLLADTGLQAFVHLGDHAYNMEMGRGARGDAYMVGFESVLSGLPWIPVIGNHELEGSPFGAYCPPSQYCEGRYLNQTRGLARAGAASGSNSTRFYSLDVGLAHISVLDYNPYLGLAGDAAAQLRWLAGDLARAAAPAQRARVPWLIVAAHVPMYASDGASPELVRDIEPLLLQYGVDLHMVGHDHFYESEWPVSNSRVARSSFVAPGAPVHVVTGAGGAPAFGAALHAAHAPHGASTPHGASAPPAWVRVHIERWSWSRVVIHNATALTWTQLDNLNGTVLDEWTIVQPNHGPFVGRE